METNNNRGYHDLKHGTGTVVYGPSLGLDSVSRPVLAQYSYSTDPAELSYSPTWRNPIQSHYLMALVEYDRDFQESKSLVNHWTAYGLKYWEISDRDLEDYCQFIAEEFESMVAQSGLKVQFTSSDPYTLDGKPNSNYMRSEVRRTGVLLVYTGGSMTGGPIPYATNLLFRAVHDYCHIITGGSFSFRGECFTAIPLLARSRGNTRRILFSEMVLQSAYYDVYGKYLDPQAIFACDDSELDYEISCLLGSVGL